MPTIYAYSDYRSFIRDVLEEKRRSNPHFSLRAAASKLGVNSGTLTRIMNGTRHLGPSLLPRFIDFLGLRRRQSEYFTLLVKLARTSDESAKRACYEEILQLRSRQRAVIGREHYRFFEKWYYPALHQLIRTVPDIDDPAELGRLLNPPITAFKAKKALELLESNGFIRRRGGCGYETVDPSLTTGETWRGAAIQSFQATMAGMGKDAVERIPQNERDVSTLTLSLSAGSYRKVRGIIQRARREILALDESDLTPEQVFQLNLQLFPLSRRIAREDGTDESR